MSGSPSSGTTCLEGSETPISGPTFIHSGDAGDTIYALPVIKWLAPAGANLILGNKQKVRCNYSQKWADNIMPLLRLQSYIRDVWLQRPDDEWTHDMDPFRALVFNKHRRGKNLTSYVCDVFGVPYQCAAAAWLKVDYPVHVEGCPVVVNKTPRYANPNFPWKRVYDTYRGRMVFVGMEDEWRSFCSALGPLPYCPTETTLDLARMIAGCRLFIGNQSLAYAIAEGLKQNTVQETYPRIPDCMFGRHNAIMGWDALVPLPDITKLK